MKFLVDYIIKEPTVDEHKKGHKFPFVAAEILNCDVNKINEYFTLTEAELEKIERKISGTSNADSDKVHSSDEAFKIIEIKEKVTEISITEKPEHEETKENTKDVNEHAINNVEKSKPGLKHMINSITDPSAETFEDKLNLGQTTDNSDLQKNRIELLDHLLSFLDTDKELNYVLAGYFAKFFSLLLNKHPHKILGYIYTQRPEVINKIIHHCDKKSISDIIPKMLLIEVYMGGDKPAEKLADNTTDYLSNSFDKANSLTPNTYSSLFNNPLTMNRETVLQLRKSAVIKLFTQLKVLSSADFERISNICPVLLEIIENRHILEIVINEREILENLIGQLGEKTETGSFETNFNYWEVLNVLINIIRSTQVENLQVPAYKSNQSEGENAQNVNSEIENSLLGDYILKGLGKILTNFQPEDSDKLKEVLGTYGTTFKPLGINKVLLVEFVYHVLTYFKNIQFGELDEILISSDFIKNLFKYLFEHEWNNLYQINFENVIKHLLNHLNNHPQVIGHMFEDLKIVEMIIAHGSHQNSFLFHSARKINNGYFSLLIELSHKISQADPSADILKDSYFTPEWNGFIKDVVNPWKKLFERKLCLPETNVSTYHDDFMFEEYDQSAGTATSNITKPSDEFGSGGESGTVSENAEEIVVNESPFDKKDEILYEDWSDKGLRHEDRNFKYESIEDFNAFEDEDDRKFYRRKSSQDNREEILLLKEKE